MVFHEPLDSSGDTKAGDIFVGFVSRMSTEPRPAAYEISKASWVRGGASSVYEVPVTLTFAGGPETRLYEVAIDKKSGKCSIDTKSSEDVSGTESHARSVLQAWLDCWVAGETMTTFKKKHPEAAAAMTMDTAWASRNSAGERLVRYEVTNAQPTAKGFRFIVTATIEDRGTPRRRPSTTPHPRTASSAAGGGACPVGIEHQRNLHAEQCSDRSTQSFLQLEQHGLGIRHSVGLFQQEEMEPALLNAERTFVLGRHVFPTLGGEDARHPE